MKIGIDARTLYIPVLKGIGVYLYNLLINLSEFDHENEYVLYFDSRQDTVFRCPKVKNFYEKGISIKKGERFFLWEQARLPLEARRDRIDIFHSPANTTMLGANCPVVVTVHDTTIQEIRKRSISDHFFYNHLQPYILRKADRIVTPSQYSKDKVADIIKINKNRIVVIPNGISDFFQVLDDKKDIEETKHKRGVSGDYILNAGGEGAWKNVSGLIRAYSLLVKKYGRSEKLVVIGIRKKSILEGHLNEISALGLTGKVVILGYVSDAELIALYNGARLFVYPSLREGFGLPPLEAMACGVPVVSSDRTSMPEVLGDAALLVDASIPEKLSETMAKALQDDGLRATLIAKGFERRKKYNWKVTAEKTLDIYRQLFLSRNK